MSFRASDIRRNRRLVPLTVHQICELVWLARRASDVVNHLIDLQEALVQQRVDTYDPSEVFLAIQGASLRFCGATEPEVENDNDDDDDEVDSPTEHVIRLRHSVRNKSLWAAATLACRCVGPARWNQMMQQSEIRRNFSALSQRAEVEDSDSSASTSSDIPLPMRLVHADSMSDRSWSPMTQPPQSLSTGMGQTWPHIPELLAAAMIRFAATESTYDPIAIEAQTILTVSLCCRPSTLVWDGNISFNIPGVQDAITSMVLNWLHGACADTPINWSFVHVVTRAIGDLYAIGWWIRSDQNENLVNKLLDVCQMACKLQVNVTNLDILHQTEEMSAAVIEIISMLASIASRAFLASDLMMKVVPVLCDLYVFFGSNRNDDLNLLDYEDDVVDAYHAVRSLQSECFKEISDLFWVLLSHEESSEIVLDALLLESGKVRQKGETHTDDEVFPEDSLAPKSFKMKLMKAGAAIRILCMALWGKPPVVMSIPTLRIHWDRVLKRCSLIICTVFKIVTEPHDALTEASFNLDVQTRRNYLSLALETIASLGLCLENEIRCTYGRMSDSEWETAIAIMEFAMLPWITSSMSNQVMGSIHMALEEFFSLVTEFLEKCYEFDVVPFADCGVQKRLYLLLLRSAIPSLTPETSQCLGSAAVKCWIKFGMFPNRVDNWAETASEILREIFRRENNDKYVHCPSIRLEALRGLTCDSDVEDDVFIPQERTALKNPTMRQLTRHIREQHIGFLSTCVIPVLKQVLDCKVEMYEDPSVDLLTRSLDKVDWEKDMGQSDFVEFLRKEHTWCNTASLEIYATRLTGELFRGTTGDRRHRELFIELLSTTALGHHHLDGNVSAERSDLSRSSFSLKICAILQLGRCLEAPFDTLPFSHESIPQIVESLCSIFERYSDCMLTESNIQVSVRASALAVLSLHFLMRLNIALDGHVSFQRGAGTTFSSIMSQFFGTASLNKTILRSLIVDARGAPLIVASGKRKMIVSGNATTVDFVRIAEVVAKFLDSSTAPNSFHRTSGPLLETKRSITIICFEILRRLASFDVCISTLHPSYTNVFGRDLSDIKERIARTKSLGQCIENVEVNMLRKTDQHYTKELNALLGVLFYAMKTASSVELTICSQVIICMLHYACCLDNPCLSDEKNEQLRSLSIEVLRDRTARLEMSSAEDQSALIGLFFVIEDLLKMSKSVPHGFLDECFSICDAVITSCKSDDCLFHVAFRCAALVLESMSATQSGEKADVCRTRRQSESLHACDAFAVFEQQIEDKVVRNTNSVEEGSGRISSPHEQLVQQAELISRFEVGQMPHQSSSWLLDENNLVTFRVGAPGTCYQGWIEVVVRRITRRARALVPIHCLPRVNFLETGTSNLVDTKTRLIPFLGGSRPHPISRREDGDEISCRLSSRIETLLERYDKIVPTTVESAEHPDSGERPPMSDAVQIPQTALVHKHRFVSVRSWLTDCLNVSSQDVSGLEEEIGNFLLSQRVIRTHADLKTHFRGLQPARAVNRAILILDRTALPNTHKMALLCEQPANEGSSPPDMEKLLLKGNRGPSGFHDFATKLGTLVRTSSLKYFSAGLDTSEYESDGQYALLWNENRKNGSWAVARKIVFHAVCFMPDDYMNRKRHVGNDHVSIIYSERGSSAILNYDHEVPDIHNSVVGGSFQFVAIFVTPAAPGATRVALRVRSGIPPKTESILKTMECNSLLPDVEAPIFVRNLATRADLLCRASLDSVDPPSNPLQRLKQLRSMERYTSTEE